MTIVNMLLLPSFYIVKKKNSGSAVMVQVWWCNVQANFISKYLFYLLRFVGYKV